MLTDDEIKIVLVLSRLKENVSYRESEVIQKSKVSRYVVKEYLRRQPSDIMNIHRFSHNVNTLFQITPKGKIYYLDLLHKTITTNEAINAGTNKNGMWENINNILVALVVGLIILIISVVLHKYDLI